MNRAATGSSHHQVGSTTVRVARRGRSWQRLSNAVGLLAWPATKRLYIVAGGEVFRSPDGGRRLEHRGAIGGEAAALLAEGPDELYVVLHDGTIKRSTDGRATWAIRSTP
jgi:photosystem II stability/assembly factor-like uncharacterized protein